MNKKGQAVFFAAIIGLAAIIIFILVLPIIMQVITAANITQPFVKLLAYFMPFFLFIMIIWGVIKIARSE